MPCWRKSPPCIRNRRQARPRANSTCGRGRLARESWGQDISEEGGSAAAFIFRQRLVIGLWSLAYSFSTEDGFASPHALSSRPERSEVESLLFSRPPSCCSAVAVFRNISDYESEQ